jgi:hypothetical protein
LGKCFFGPSAFGPSVSALVLPVGFIVPGRDPRRAALEMPTFLTDSPACTRPGTVFFGASVCAKPIPEAKRKTNNKTIRVMVEGDVEMAN